MSDRKYEKTEKFYSIFGNQFHFIDIFPLYQSNIIKAYMEL